MIKTIIILAAGASWLLVSGVFVEANELEKIVLASCLGITCALLVSSLFILAKLPYEFAGDGMFAAALLLLIAWLHSKPKLRQPRQVLKKLSRYWLPSALFFFHLFLWIAYFSNYPYFPNSEPPDAVWHAEITLSILQGSFTTPIAQAGFPAGAHILFAFVGTYFGVSVLTAERVMAAFVESLSVLVAYCLFQRILPSKRSADYASFAFAVIIPAGLVYYVRLGAYPNVVGDFFVLASLLLIILVQRRLTFASILTAILVQAITLVSHVSVAIFALFVILFSVVVAERFRSHIRAYLISISGFLLFPLAAVLAAPFSVAREFQYISFNYFQINTDLAVYSRVWLHNFLALPGPINFVLLLAGFTWVLTRARKHMWLVFLATWFAFLSALVFFATFGERLILLSFVPGAGLMGVILAELHGAIRRIALPKIPPRWLGRILVGVFMLVLVIALAVQGPSPVEVSQIVAPGQAERQRHIYESMMWIQANTPPNASVVSVGLVKEYRYLPLVTNRSYLGDFQLDSDHILKLRSSLNFDYVVVSTEFARLSKFYNSNTLHVLYQNSDIVIFAISANS